MGKCKCVNRVVEDIINRLQDFVYHASSDEPEAWDNFDEDFNEIVAGIKEDYLKKN